MGMITRHNQKAKEALKKASKPIPVKKVEPKKAESKEVYTKSEITTMNVAKLRELATKQGIDNADEFTGVELKKILIEKMGL